MNTFEILFSEYFPMTMIGAGAIFLLCAQLFFRALDWRVKSRRHS